MLTGLRIVVILNERASGRKTPIFMPDNKREKQIGQVFTPDFIVRQMLDYVGYNVGKEILEKHIIDNSCGNGAFLKEAVKRYIEAAKVHGVENERIKDQLETYIHGIDCDAMAISHCVIELTDLASKYGIHNIVWDVCYGDTLKTTKYDGHMHFVVGNPPYVRVHNLDNTYNDAKMFSFAKGGMTDLYLVFFEIGFNMLAHNGRMCYITPSSWLSSVAGSLLRRHIITHGYLESLIDLGHYQPFEGITTYTIISVFDKQTYKDSFDFYTFNAVIGKRSYETHISYSDCVIDGKFYLADEATLTLLRRIKSGNFKSKVTVKNGFATLADKCFIGDNIPDSTITIPVIKGSTARWTKALFPYDKKGKPLTSEQVFAEHVVAEHFKREKKALLKGRKEYEGWWLYGRTQALGDVWKRKFSINSLIRNSADLKIVELPKGTGIYSGLYIIGDIKEETLRSILQTEDFVSYVRSLRKYKSGGYYTFNSKDIEQFINYKLLKGEYYEQQRIPTSDI